MNEVLAHNPVSKISFKITLGSTFIIRKEVAPQRLKEIFTGLILNLLWFLKVSSLFYAAVKQKRKEKTTAAKEKRHELTNDHNS